MEVYDSFSLKKSTFLIASTLVVMLVKVTKSTILKTVYVYC